MMKAMMKMFLRAAALSVVVASASAYGQQGTTEVLYLTLTNVSSCDGISVAVVMLGRDGERKPATYAGDCKWRFESPFGSFNTKITNFSLRLSGFRTRCRRSRYDAEQRAAVLDFRYSGAGSAKQLSIDVDSKGELGYARQLEGRGPDVPCIERGMLPETVADVEFNLEKLRLQLLPKQPPACGVILNSIARIANAPKGVPVTLTKSDAVAALAKQGNAADDCRTPTFSGAALDVAEQSFRQVVITVK